MSNSTKAVEQYFDSANKFMQSYFNWLKGLSPSTGNNPDAEKAFAGYEKWMTDFMGKMEDFIKQQINEASNMTPKEIQTQNLKDLNEFEDSYKKASDGIIDYIEKQKKYMESDDYLKDVEKGKEQANSIYSTSLNSLSSVFDNYSKMFKNLK